MVRALRLSYYRVLSSRLWGPALVAVGIAALTRSLLHVFSVRIPDWPSEVGVDCGLFLAPVVLLFGLRLLGVQRTWRDIEATLLQVRASGRPILTYLVRTRIGTLRKDIAALAAPDGLIPHIIDLWRWLDDLFLLGGSFYIGVDSNVPTRYQAEYQTYLAIHKKALGLLRAQLKTPPKHVRVMVATRTALSKDYFEDSPAFLQFIRWHEDNGVSLRWIQPRAIRKIASKHAVRPAEGRDYPDVALWEHYAVLFRDVGGESPNLRMRFPRDAKRGRLAPEYAALAAYAEDVEQAAVPFPHGPPGLEVVSEEVARRWPDYVGVGERLRDDGPLAKLLRDVTRDARLVLDAAAGIGCEAILLQQSGLSVVSNEVDEYLRVQATQLAKAHGVKLRLEQQMWEELDDENEGGLKFDTILCLGNSLCLVTDSNLQRSIVAGFAKLLRPGGRLVIDERNFQWMLDHRTEIVADPVANWPFFGGDAMYSGRRVRGVPITITDDTVEWLLFDNQSKRRSRDEITAASIDGTRLILRPFKHGELYRVLQGAGLVVEAIYADLVRVADGSLPRASALSEAAFLTYVAVKPERKRKNTERGDPARERHSSLELRAHGS